MLVTSTVFRDITWINLVLLVDKNCHSVPGLGRVVPAARHLATGLDVLVDLAFGGVGGRGQSRAGSAAASDGGVVGFCAAAREWGGLGLGAGRLTRDAHRPLHLSADLACVHVLEVVLKCFVETIISTHG